MSIFENTALGLSRVCDYLEARDVPYSLAYGTLLGAVRHRGFIPHDNDVDLFLPKRYSGLISEMATYFAAKTKYNTPPWNRESYLQKIIFDDAYDIDFFNEDHPDVKGQLQLLQDLFVVQTPALETVEFCNRPFRCMSNPLEYLLCHYGQNCLEQVDLKYRGDGSYRNVPANQKMSIQEYEEQYRSFVQPDLTAMRARTIVEVDG